jgi:hypothetical protein
MKYGADVVGIVGNAEIVHPHCFCKEHASEFLKIMQGEDVPDSEGNAYGVILYGTEDMYNVDGVRDSQGRMQPQTCGKCLRYIVEDERELVLHHGDLGLFDSQGSMYASYNWNDCGVSWPDECECGASLDDMEDEHGCIPDNCPDCGAEMIVQTFERCAECGERFTHGWLCLDGGDMYCGTCVTIE